MAIMKLPYCVVFLRDIDRIDKSQHALELRRAGASNVLSYVTEDVNRFIDEVEFPLVDKPKRECSELVTVLATHVDLLIYDKSRYFLA